MSKEYINPNNLFPSQQYGFSQIVTAVPGKLVFISGQVAWDANQQLIGPGDLHQQMVQSLKNVARAMQHVGGNLSDIVSMRIYIVAEQIHDTTAVRDALLTFFPADALPTSTWLAVPALANEEFLVEIEPIAIIK